MTDIKDKIVSPELASKIINVETNVDYIVKGIAYVIDTFEKRFAGSKGERDAQKYFVDELSNICDSVIEEEFTVHPNSFLDWLYVTPSLFIASLLFYFFMPLVSVLLVIAGLFPFVSQLILYKTWLDPFYKKGISSNVFGVMKPSGELKRRVILCGHTDAAREWTWHRKYGVKGVVATTAGSLTGAFYVLVLSALSMANGRVFFGMIDTVGAALMLGIAGAVFMPFWLMCYFFSNKRVVVDGANDNLSANFVAVAVMKVLKESGIKLKHTELCSLMTGSEEIGLRGAKAFAKVHKAEHSDVETIVIVMETLRDLEHFSLYVRDINGFVQTNKDVAALVKAAGKANGVNIKYAAVPLGATDSGAFAQAGYQSTCLAAVSHNLQDYYHTRRDTKDNIDPIVLGKALNIVIDSVLLYDENGLIPAQAGIQ